MVAFISNWRTGQLVASSSMINHHIIMDVAVIVAVVDVMVDVVVDVVVAAKVDVVVNANGQCCGRRRDPQCGQHFIMGGTLWLQYKKV